MIILVVLMGEKFIFPSEKWMSAFCSALNENEKYASAAKKWEGSILFVVTNLPDKIAEIYGGRTKLGFVLDLWHGECRGAKWFDDPDSAEADYVIEAKYDDWKKIIEGKLSPIPALTTRKLKIVKGSLGTIMRFASASLEMVKSAQRVPTKFLI